MLPYARIAVLLEEIGKADRGNKAPLVADLLVGLSKEMLCPCVRLLTGELWPAWEKREMGMGPEAIGKALDEISAKDVQNSRKDLRDMGMVAEDVLRRKSQHSVSKEPLEALGVYQSLNRISYQHGADSEHRQGAILRGLFLDAEPIEAKYIARTVMRSMKVGLGPRTVIAAMAVAFDVDRERIMKAYALMPELGLLANAVSDGALERVAIKPPRPVRPMLFRKGKLSNASATRAYIPRYAGIRVQLHKVGGDLFVYTMRLKDITSAIGGLYRELQTIGHDFAVEAQLIGFRNDVMIGLQEMVRYINHKSRSRRSAVLPALMAWDLIYLDDEDLTSFEYEERHRRLEALLGETKPMPFTGISTVEQMILGRSEEVKEYYTDARQKGFRGLIARDLHAPYLPGGSNDADCYL